MSHRAEFTVRCNAAGRVQQLSSEDEAQCGCGVAVWVLTCCAHVKGEPAGGSSEQPVGAAGGVVIAAAAGFSGVAVVAVAEAEAAVVAPALALALAVAAPEAENCLFVWKVPIVGAVRTLVKATCT